MSGSFSWSRHGDGSSPHSAAGKPLDVAKQTVPISDQLQRVYDAWDPQSPRCAFQHYFYNRVPPEQAPQYVMPPGQDPRKWEKAMLARPDPASVPVLAVGFTDLQKRTSLQNEQVNAYRVRLHEINDKLIELKNRHDLNTTVKLMEMRERHGKLARRALALAVRIQVLSNRGALLTPQEELLQQHTREIIKHADDPAVFGSLNEAWARVKALKQQAQQKNSTQQQAQQQAIKKSDSQPEGLDWENNRLELEAIVRILAAQQKGIKFLAQTLADDKQLLDEELGLVPRKPKQKAIPASAVAPQAFAADVPVTVQPIQQQIQQPIQQPQSGLMGQQKPAGLLGSQTQQQGGIFGSQAKPATGGIFGSQQQQQQQTQPQSGGLFGSQPSQSGGLFGSQNKPATGGLFGNQPKPATGGLFGSQTSQPASGGLFGNQSQTTQPATSGGLFGNQSQTTQPATSGGLFGNQSQTTQPATGGLFGNQPQTSQPATGGGLFGNQSQTTQPSGGLFGSQQTQTTQPATSGGLFGNQASQPATGGGLFGSQQSQTTQQTGGIFGQSKPAGSLFGLK